jgi:hypothetical protein
MVFSATFNNISVIGAVSVIGGGNRRTRRKPPKRGTIRTHWYADDLLKQCPSKGDKYDIDEELQHTDHLFLGVACKV